MALKDDLEKAFEDTLQNKGEISDIAKAITKAYENAVNDSFDSMGNSWQGQAFDLVEKAIEAAFTLTLNAKVSPLLFTTIETSLVACWTPAILKLPASNPMMSVVIKGSVINSVAVPTLPISGESDNYDAIVGAFYDMFTLHANTLNFSYSGLAIAGTPPPPLILPVSKFTIK